MQKISFGDKDYVKASVIAKRYKYTQDYVGQLCRNKKVDARLVGRTWYVVPESVTAYRKTKHKTQKVSKPSIAKTRDRAKDPVNVVPVMRGKTVKSLRRAAPNVSAVTLTTTYGKDTNSHIPIVTSKSNKATKNDRVSAADSKPIETKKTGHKSALKKIKVVPHTKKNTVLSAEKIPEITLSAKLKVHDNIEGQTSQPSLGANKKESLSPKVSAVVNNENNPVEIASKADMDIVLQPVKTPAKSAELGEASGSVGTLGKKTNILSAVIVVVGLVGSIFVLGTSFVYEIGEESFSESLDFSIQRVLDFIIE